MAQLVHRVVDTIADWGLKGKYFKTQQDGDDFRNVLTAAEAEQFLTVLREQVWPSPDKAPSKIGAPSARIIEMVEAEDYR